MSGFFFNEYPYTDFHELNLTWVIKKMIELNKTVKDFVSLNAIKYADPIEWNITTQYEKNTVVIDPATGTAYLSTQEVPNGVNIDNTDYWTVIFDLSSLIEDINNNLTIHNAGQNHNAPFNSAVGDWILIDNVLYIATREITEGDSYVFEGDNINVRRTTVEAENEVIYYANDKALSMHMKINDYSEIVTTGDVHVYNPLTRCIEIRKV